MGKGSTRSSSEKSRGYVTYVTATGKTNTVACPDETTSRKMFGCEHKFSKNALPPLQTDKGFDASELNANKPLPKQPALQINGENINDNTWYISNSKHKHGEKDKHNSAERQLEKENKYDHLSTTTKLHESTFQSTAWNFSQNPNTSVPSNEAKIIQLLPVSGLSTKTQHQLDLQPHESDASKAKDDAVTPKQEYLKLQHFKDTVATPKQHSFELKKNEKTAKVEDTGATLKQHKFQFEQNNKAFAKLQNIIAPPNQHKFQVEHNNKAFTELKNTAAANKQTRSNFLKWSSYVIGVVHLSAHMIPFIVGAEPGTYNTVFHSSVSASLWSCLFIFS